jgi:hypothetical protein
VIKVNDASARPKEARAPRPSMAVARPKRLTTVIQDPVLLPLPTQREPDAAAAPRPEPRPVRQAAASVPPPVATPAANDPGAAGPATIEGEVARVEPSRPVAVPPGEGGGERTPRPTVVIESPAAPDPAAAPGVEDLTPVRLRPRRVIVIK